MNNILWLHFSRPRPHWYEASDSRRDELDSVWAGVRVASVGRGAVRLGSWSVRGQHDFSSVEVWQFPDIDAAASHWLRLVDAAYTDWFAADNVIGAPGVDAAVHAPHITNWPRA